METRQLEIFQMFQYLRRLFGGQQQTPVASREVHVRFPDGTHVHVRGNGTLRIRRTRKAPKVKLVPVPVVMVVPVPVRETIFVAPPPGPTAEEIAYAILQELEGAQRLRRDLDQTEEEVAAGQNGQPHYRYSE